MTFWRAESAYHYSVTGQAYSTTDRKKIETVKQAMEMLRDFGELPTYSSTGIRGPTILELPPGPLPLAAIREDVAPTVITTSPLRPVRRSKKTLSTPVEEGEAESEDDADEESDELGMDKKAANKKATTVKGDDVGDGASSAKTRRTRTQVEVRILFFLRYANAK